MMTMIFRYFLTSLIVWKCFGQDLCPRRISLVEEGRRCLAECNSDSDCESGLEICTCDDVCGMSCINPAPQYREIIFLIDDSKYLGNKQIEQIKDWVITISNQFNIEDNSTRIGIVQYSHYFPEIPLLMQRSSRNEIVLGQYTNRNVFNGAVRNLNIHSFTTYTAAALLKVLQDFQSSPRFNDRDTTKILILLTDGSSNDVENLPTNAAALRSQGIITFAVGVGDATHQQLRLIATGNIASIERVYYISRFSRLNNIDDKLAKAITSAQLEAPVCPTPVAPENGVVNYTGMQFTYNQQVTYGCNVGYMLEGSSNGICNINSNWGEVPTCVLLSCTVPAPSLNGSVSAQPGERINFGQFITYTCDENYRISGQNSSSLSVRCEVGGVWSQSTPTCVRAPTPLRDVMFLLDGSDSVGSRNFERVKEWVIALSSRFTIEDNSTRIGVVQYSHYFPDIPLDQQPYIQTEIELGQFTNKSLFNEAVRNISLQRFTTYTATALLKVIQDFQSSPRFNNSDTSKILVVLTDGASSDVEFLQANAAEVRSQGITTFAIGVGEANTRELRDIATGDPQSDERVFYAANFDDLDDISNQLTNAIAVV